MKRTTVFTCSIYPDLTRVWFHFIRKYTNPADVCVTIYDCGSRLNQKHFSGANIVRHRNHEHGRKIDHFVRTDANTPLVFLLDDDVFLLSESAEADAADRLITEDDAAAFSYKPRGWWEFEIDGTRYPVMGSYSVLFKPSVIRDETLSFCTVPTRDASIRNGSGYYDTADFANEQLIRRGFSILMAEETEQERNVRSYSGVSSGFVDFARRGLLSKRFRLAKDRGYWVAKVASSAQLLERSVGVSATIELYRMIFGEPPQFDDFFSYDDLAEIANGIGDDTARAKAVSIVEGYRELLATLRDAA